MDEPDPDIQTQMILLASSNHNLEALRTLLRTGSANVQDPETGFTPLHAAIAACEGDDKAADGVDEPARKDGNIVNGHGKQEEEQEQSTQDMERAKKTLKLLFQNGAIWNDLDNNGETPGCLAWRLGLMELYEIIVDAGVRAELLLNRLDEYEPLPDEGSEDAEDDVVEEEKTQDMSGDSKHSQPEGEAMERDAGLSYSSHGAPQHASAEQRNSDVNTADYLASGVIFQEDKLVDADSNGVMMVWETDIMKRSAELLLPTQGLRVLNVGHGMGIIDTFFQDKSPAQHHIIEAHPGVLEKMRRDGWYDKPNVTVHEGKWQDVLPKLVEQNVVFDAIYFDTFAEDYKSLRDFFTEHVIGVLDPAGKFGFFNGLGADRQVCYDVYAKVVEMDLFEAGFDTEWETLKVSDLQRPGEWDGVRRKYWTLQEYKLPTCNFIG